MIAQYNIPRRLQPIPVPSISSSLKKARRSLSVGFKSRHLSNPRENADQLFSYMRLLKLNVGLLILDVVQLYYDDPSECRQSAPFVDIPARSDCEEGAALVRSPLMKDGLQIEPQCLYRGNSRSKTP